MGKLLIALCGIFYALLMLLFFADIHWFNGTGAGTYELCQVQDCVTRTIHHHKSAAFVAGHFTGDGHNRHGCRTC
jgi:hypothetical protein